MELFTGEEYWGPRVPRGGAVGVQKFGGGLKGHIFHGLDFPLVLERDIRNSGLVHTRQWVCKKNFKKNFFFFQKFFLKFFFKKTSFWALRDAIIQILTLSMDSSQKVTPRNDRNLLHI